MWIFWLLGGNVNCTNVYNDRTSNSKREREREREREGAGHSKVHLLDLLMISVYFGDAILFSLTRHFDGCPVPVTRPKNSLMS